MKEQYFYSCRYCCIINGFGDGHKQTSSDKEQSEHKDNHNKIK